MRPSTAVLAQTKIRLAELNFPRTHVHVERTRLAFIHLDNLLHFAKVDRDGKVDAFVVAYLPTELVVLLLRAGELTNAVRLRESGRSVLSTVEALDAIRAERERGELLFCNAPAQQLAWMYQSCAAPAQARMVDMAHPDALFPALAHEGFSGVLELIGDGRLSYLQFEGGEYRGGVFSAKPAAMSAAEYVGYLCRPGPTGKAPHFAAAVFPHIAAVPEQASPQMLESYREVFWAVAAAGDAEVAGEGTKLAVKYRELLHQVHPSIRAIGLPRDRAFKGIVATPTEVTAALAEWTMQVLEQLEILSPGAAPDVLRSATRAHRFLLQRSGFYDGLPWAVRW
ncbi:MAG TPA: hypothetical protein VGA22_00830 [Gemmatimonadales bacterium]|jgi:hypothetical protein